MNRSCNRQDQEQSDDIDLHDDSASNGSIEVTEGEGRPSRH